MYLTLEVVDDHLGGHSLTQSSLAGLKRDASRSRLGPNLGLVLTPTLQFFPVGIKTREWAGSDLAINLLRRLGSTQGVKREPTSAIRQFPRGFQVKASHTC
jgi:hypothetical protein